MARDRTIEINDLKSRNEFSNSHEYSLRLFSLGQLLKNIDDSEINKNEVYRYIPIALVACIEGFFRSIYAEIIDSGEPYSNNVKQFNKSNIKFDFNIVSAIQSKKLSIGEFVSHTLPCNNINDIDNNMSILLGEKFLDQLKSFETNSKHNDINSLNRKYRENSDEIIKGIKKIFRLRHIFCHELATRIDFEKKEIIKLFDDCSIFLNNVYEYVGYCLDPNAPETQVEMNDHARNEFEKLDKQLSDYISRIKTFPYIEYRNFDWDLFDESILKWKEYRECEAKLQSSIVEGGRMYLMMFSSSLASTTYRKIKELEEDYPDVFE